MLKLITFLDEYRERIRPSFKRFRNFKQYNKDGCGYVTYLQGFQVPYFERSIANKYLGKDSNDPERLFETTFPSWTTHHVLYCTPLRSFTFSLSFFCSILLQYLTLIYIKVLPRICQNRHAEAMKSLISLSETNIALLFSFSSSPVRRRSTYAQRLQWRLIKLLLMWMNLYSNHIYHAIYRACRDGGPWMPSFICIRSHFDLSFTETGGPSCN